MARFVFFFFSSRRRHTRLQGDWSSDVCSSDLSRRHPGRGPRAARQSCRCSGSPRAAARDRESVVEGKRVDLGGRRIIKKKKKRVAVIVLGEGREVYRHVLCNDSALRILV